jgi:hypothetical protein
LNEAVWGGDKKRVGVYKTIFSDETRELEKKFKDAFPVRNYAKAMAASNEDWFAPIGAADRRHAVFEVSPRHAQDIEYFASLRRAMEVGGEREALLYDLLEREADYDALRRAPSWNSELRRDQAERSLSPTESFVQEILLDGDLSMRIGDVRMRAYTVDSYRKVHHVSSFDGDDPSTYRLRSDFGHPMAALDWEDLWHSTRPVLLKDELYQVFVAWCNRQRIAHFPGKSIFYREMNRIEGLVTEPDRKLRFVECRPGRAIVLNTYAECLDAWNHYAPAASTITALTTAHAA